MRRKVSSRALPEISEDQECVCLGAIPWSACPTCKKEPLEKFMNEKKGDQKCSSVRVGKRKPYRHIGTQGVNKSVGNMKLPAMTRCCKKKEFSILMRLQGIHPMSKINDVKVTDDDDDELFVL